MHLCLTHTLLDSPLLWLAFSNLLLLRPNTISLSLEMQSLKYLTVCVKRLSMIVCRVVFPQANAMTVDPL